MQDSVARSRAAAAGAAQSVSSADIEVRDPLNGGSMV
jgi:hypothetical protein